MLQLSDRRNLPPMLVQYLEYKDQYPDAFLFFQVGDFYELFFDDAVKVATELNLTLTSRDKGADPIPMCGVPIGAVEGYLSRLVQNGYSVAIVSQQPVPNGFKGMVPRRLDRIITPGVQLLGGDGLNHGVVGAIFAESVQGCIVATTDVQSGMIVLDEGLHFHQDLLNVLERRMVQEVVWYDRLEGLSLDRRNSTVRIVEARVGTNSKWRGDSYLKEGAFEAVQGFSHASPSVRKCVRLLLNYLEEITINVSALKLSLVTRSEIDSGEGRRMSIDATTRTNLEIDRNIRTGQKEGSLWGSVDKCSTSIGSRRLRDLLIAPLADVATIRERQDLVRVFHRQGIDRNNVQQLLRRNCDMSRVATRIGLGVVTPRELGSVRDTLRILPDIAGILSLHPQEGLLYTRMVEALTVCPELYAAFAEFLVDELPPSLKEGGVVRDEFDPDVARARSLATGGRSWFERFAEEERVRTGITSLKVKFNNVLGFFIEVTLINATKVPPEYEPRQSTTNTRRYVVPELKAAEKEYFKAHETMVAREQVLYEIFVNERRADISILRGIGEALADLDVLVTGGEIAGRGGSCYPEVYDGRDEGNQITIQDGKHPVLKEVLGDAFIPNSVQLGGESQSLMIVTGPNMGGKSTFLRQTALMTILAQIGWCVPAAGMKLNVVDKVFARLGASDNLLEGESTFMVEMREAGMILTQATSRSLVVIDEIGRGTSTTDGVALAQSILEWLVHDIRCRCLFATHYHQLSELNDPRICNVSVQAEYQDGLVVFTHRIAPGAASRSYGLEVARLAGLPEKLLLRARHLLKEGEQLQVQPQNVSTVFDSRRGDGELFSSEVYQSRKEYLANQKGREIMELLNELDPANITPQAAMNLIFELKSIA
jgi:DNA mismatch repair protein MutS